MGVKKIDILSILEQMPRMAVTTPKTITLSLMEKYVIDTACFAINKRILQIGTFKTLTTQKVFEKAEKIQAVPFFTYKDVKGVTRHYYDVIVYTI